MSKLNHDILRKNIRSLMESRGTTQAELAESIGMSQPNLSKALKPDDKKRFTLDQVFQISQYFGVSIDELTGNKVAEQVATSPRSALAFLVDLYRKRQIKFTKVNVTEVVYQQFYNEHGYPDSRREDQQQSYPAFYFPNHADISEYASCEEDYCELDAEFSQCGNETQFIQLNAILENLLPLTRMCRDEEIPEEAFKMILNGYLEQLPNK